MKLLFIYSLTQATKIASKALYISKSVLINY